MSVPPARAPRAHLGLETLEHRDNPSVSFNISEGVLDIDGGLSADVVTINDSGNGTLKIYNAGVFHTFSGVDEVKVSTNGGNDNVAIYMQGSRIRAISYDISLGNGDDDFSFEGNQKALPGHTDVTVHGNFGNDDLTADLNGSVVGGFTILNLYGDAGDDDISTYANGTDIVNSFANLDIQLDGNAGDDTLEAFYRGENDGHLTVQLSGGTNSDHVSADVTFDTGSTGWMSSSFVDGGDGNDFLKFFVRKTASDPIAINAEFSGGLGFDSGLISDDYVQHDNSTESLSTV